MNHRLIQALAWTALAAAVACAVVGLRLQWDLREIAQQLGGTPDLSEPHHWLAAAAALMLGALALAVWQQALQRRALGPLPPMDLSALRTPQVPMAALVRLGLEAYGPTVMLPVAGLALFKWLLVQGRPLLAPWPFLGSTLALMALICLGLLPWLMRRLVRLSWQPRMEPLFNLNGLLRLRRSTTLPHLLAPGEQVLESVVLGHPQRLWLVLTPTRLLCLRRGWRGDALVRSIPRADLWIEAPSTPSSLPAAWWAAVKRWQQPYQLQHPLHLRCRSGADVRGVMNSGAACERWMGHF